MLWHTWSIRFAVMLRKWFCLNETKPPSYMINCAEDRILLRKCTYFVFIFTRSKLSCFDKLYPSYFTGRVASHEDASFSWLILFKRVLLVGKLIIKLSVLSYNFSFLISFFSSANSSLLLLYSVDCSKCSIVKDSMMLLEFSYFILANQQKWQFPYLQN